MKWLTAAALLVAAIAAVLIASWRFGRGTDALVERLASDAAPSTRVTDVALDELPDPVQRYFRLVVRENQPLPHHHQALVRQRGRFRIDESESGWREFQAIQHFSADPPGFVWDARIRMAPGIEVRVRDAYVRGRGSMQARLCGIVPLVSQENDRELALGALQRFLAEAAWIPAALLPGRGVEWSALDEDSAVASLADSGHEVALTFRFDDAGRIVEIFTENRFREVDGSYVPTPWRATFGSYEERGGLLVPTEAEVEWVLPEGPYPYWRGRIESIEYDSLGD